MKQKYIVGIDLGTTNCVLAYKDLQNDTESAIPFFPIHQHVKANRLEDQNGLPSFLYLPGEHDLPKGGIALPWKSKQDYFVGEFARQQGSKVPGRLVSSAKSWLSHPGVNRESELLPLGAEEEVSKISPVEASSRYLRYIKDAWNHQMGKDSLLENQAIFLTVPASFDAVARDLTVKAAREAGLKVTLLEEPQAAFYSWLHRHEQAWRDQLSVGDLVLVVDVGGGTTDFSLVSVTEEDGSLSLQRDAVGNHILLGGDNMDLALAHVVSTKLPEKNKLDAWQSMALWHSCREAKEKMLADPKLKDINIVVPGRSSRLIGGSLKAKLTREELEKTLIDGFFPKISASDHEIQQRRIGLTQINLPYASDPAITRHIAHFLHQNRKEDQNLATPTAILFNGGVFQASSFQNHIVETVNSWLAEEDKPALKVLENNELDLSVAKGATYYGTTKMGEGIRIRGGTARSYYLGIESSMPAVPGMPLPMKALCVVPHGMEEGTEADVPEMKLNLVLDAPVEFPFFSSNERKDDTIGDMVEQIGEEIEDTARLEVTLKAPEGMKSGDFVPVKLHSKVTEIGTLQISCRSEDGRHSWDLEFNLRD